MNLIKQIIKSVVSGSSARAGCNDYDSKYIRKLNRLADSGTSKDLKRVIKALGKLAAYGINLEDI